MFIGFWFLFGVVVFGCWFCFCLVCVVFMFWFIFLLFACFFWVFWGGCAGFSCSALLWERRFGRLGVNSYVNSRFVCTSIGMFLVFSCVLWPYRPYLLLKLFLGLYFASFRVCKS